MIHTWETIACSMLAVDKLPNDLSSMLSIAANRCEQEDGVLRSRQAVAAIIAVWELKKEMEQDGQDS